MKMFGKLTQDGLEETGDRLGSGGVLETDAYTGRVKLAYAGKASASNAQSVTVVIDLGNREYRETFWITNKAGENFYPDKKDASKKQPLPGFTSVDDLCLLTTGFPLSEQAVEDKVVALYDFEQKRDIPTNVPVLVDLLGKEVTAAVVKQIVDKQKKDTSGNYINTGETRDENVVDKFFHAGSGRTVSEIKGNIETGIFLSKWVEKNKHQTRNRVKGAEGKSGVPGASKPFGAANTSGGPAPAPKKSLFGG